MPVGHWDIRSENRCGTSEKGSGFGGLDGTPPPKFPGNTPPLPPREKESHIQTKPDTNRTNKERTLPFVLLVFAAV